MIQVLMLEPNAPTNEPKMAASAVTDPEGMDNILIAGGSLNLRYRVFIHHGNYREAQVADAYKKYAAAK
jgi:tetraacyldisaccharide-1-P 4'-kinase